MAISDLLAVPEGGLFLIGSLFQKGGWHHVPVTQSDPRNFVSAQQRNLLNPLGGDFLSKLKAPHRGTSLGPFV
jgi:hypothetical protein